MEKIENLLHRDREEILGFCGRYDSVFIYGAGKVAKEMILYLAEEEIHIKGIIVGTGHKKAESYCGYYVSEIQDREYGVSDGIILGIAEDKQNQAFNDLLIAGVNERDIYLQKIFGQKISCWNRSAVSIGENTDGEFFVSKKRLNDLGTQCQTDKSAQYHNYLRKYEFFLEAYRSCEMNVLELGVFNGGSLKMWEKYFEKAFIYGADINSDCEKYENARRKIVICDLSMDKSYDVLKCLKPTIIIDDASHMWSHQIKALHHLLPALMNGGVYIVEDLGTNFSERRVYNYDDASVSCYELLQEIAKVVTSGEIPNLSDMKSKCVPFADEILFLARQIDMITFIRESCIIIKK